MAVVTEEPRLKMDWRGKTIVDLSRASWTPMGHIRRRTTLEVPGRAGNLFDKVMGLT